MTKDKLMSRKDYIAMAKILGDHDASDNLVVDFIDLLVKDNPRFDRLKFFEAVRKVN